MVIAYVVNISKFPSVMNTTDDAESQKKFAKVF